jgi:hypothetical protein
MSVDPKARERQRDASRRMGIVRLIRQLAIIKGRIRSEFAHTIDGSGNESPSDEWTPVETLTLDLETYYTVAFDLLTLAELLLPNEKATALRKHKTFKRIAVLRNQRTRHAYNKPNGMHDCNVNWNGEVGPSLHYDRLYDPGFFLNHKELDDLIGEFDITHLYADPRLPVLRAAAGAAASKGIKVKVRF